MGGNVFPQAERISLAEFREAAQVLFDNLGNRGRSQLGSVCPTIPLGDKADFGDVDVYTTSIQALILDQIPRRFDVAQDDIVVNEKSLHFPLQLSTGKIAQVDVTFVEEDSFMFSIWYYSYNDIPNLLGVMLKVLGFRLGHEGLFYTLDGSNGGDAARHEKVLVTTSVELLGDLLDEPFWTTIALRSKEEWFKDIVESKLFKPEYFSMENRNSKNRVRDAKRKTYQDFLEYIKDKPGREFEEEVVKEELLNQALEMFPGFKERLEAARAAHVELNRRKSLFNPDAFKGHVPLLHKDLQYFMKLCKALGYDEYLYNDQTDKFVGAVKTLHAQLSKIYRK